MNDLTKADGGAAVRNRWLVEAPAQIRLVDRRVHDWRLDIDSTGEPHRQEGPVVSLQIQSSDVQPAREMRMHLIREAGIV